jgi:hypothetical protein
MLRVHVQGFAVGGRACMNLVWISSSGVPMMPVRFFELAPGRHAAFHEEMRARTASIHFAEVGEEHDAGRVAVAEHAP